MRLGCIKLTCARSVVGDAPVYQTGEGGSIPSWRFMIFLQTQQKNDAAGLVEQFHYSRLFPPVTTDVFTWHSPGGLFGDLGPALAACCFSLPCRVWTHHPIWELVRLVKREGVQVPPLSSLISQSIRSIKQNRPIDLLISYADTEQNHHGGIYQAASWAAGLLKSTGSLLAAVLSIGEQ